MPLIFVPWRKGRAYKDDAQQVRFLAAVAQGTHRRLRAGMEASRGGRVYRRRGGRLHRASAPGAYPARETGALISSIRHEVRPREAVVGTNRRYSIYLRLGTRKMARRKMSDSALRETVPSHLALLRKFARWRFGS